MKRFPSLTAEIAAAATEALERFRDESRRTVLRLVEMESSYLTVDFFRKQQMETERQEKGQNPSGPNMDRYTEMHLRRIGMFKLNYATKSFTSLIIIFYSKSNRS